MPRRVHHADARLAQRDFVTVLEQRIEHGRLGLGLRRAEQRAETRLHLGDPRPDADLRAGLAADMIRRGEMIGMRMRLQRPLHRKTQVARPRQHGVR